MPQDNLELARLTLDHFNSGNREALRALTAPDAEIVPLRAALEGTVFSGETGFDDFWKAIDETWESTYIDPDEMVDCGDRVLLVGRLRGRAKGTDVEVNSPMAWVVTIGDGKVAALRTYTDIAEARRAAGQTD